MDLFSSKITGIQRIVLLLGNTFSIDQDIVGVVVGSIIYLTFCGVMFLRAFN